MEEHFLGVSEGHPDSIHKARVATRRLREILSLVDGAADTRVASDVRKAGRCLGRIRDLDVESAILLRVEEQLAATAPVTAVARAAIRRRRGKKLRKAIKKLEHLDLNALSVSALAPRSSWRQRLGLMTGWRTQLQARTADRALGVRTAVAHATGVYFPQRAHSTRIAVKKLRYVVEIASVTGMWRPPRLLKDLRKVQSLLGELHDAETLLGSLDGFVADADLSPRSVGLVRQVLEGEIADLHGGYTSARESLLDACAACERFADRGSRYGRVALAGSLVAASIAMPAALLVSGSVKPRDENALLRLHL